MHWEYMTKTLKVAGFLKYPSLIEPDNVNELLNPFGSEGWELVSSLTMDEKGTSQTVVFIFKRPTDQPSPPTDTDATM